MPKSSKISMCLRDICREEGEMWEKSPFISVNVLSAAYKKKAVSGSFYNFWFSCKDEPFVKESK